MYRIQAHIPSESRIEVLTCKSWEYAETMAKIKANPKYGLVTIEWLARYD